MSLRDAALAPVPIRIEDGRDDAVWPDIPRYLLAARYWFERDMRIAMREAATTNEAEALAARNEPSFDRNAVRPEGGPPHVYWPATEPMLWRRAVHERAMQDEAFRQQLLADGAEAVAGEDFLAAALTETAARMASTNLAKLTEWMLPPRLKAPWIAKGSIGWRMGGGERYLIEFDDWRGALSRDETAAYRRAYPQEIW